MRTFSLYFIFIIFGGCRIVPFKKNELKFEIVNPGSVGNNFGDFYLRMCPKYTYKQISYYHNNKLNRVDIYLSNSSPYKSSFYLITSRYIDSSTTQKSGDTMIILESKTKYIKKNGNISWAMDENRNITQYEYYYKKDTLIVKKYINNELQDLITKYLFNKKNKPILLFEYTHSKLNGYYRYTYKDDSIPVLIEEFNSNNFVTGVKKIEYKNRLIILNSISFNNLFAIDSVFLDSNNNLLRVSCYTKNFEDVLELSNCFVFSFHKMDSSTKDFIREKDIELFNRLKRFH